MNQIKKSRKGNYSSPLLPHSHFEHFVFFLAYDKAKNAHMVIWGGEALLGSKCMGIKASYVQARRFIDFHTLILNSYQKKYKGDIR